MLKRNALRERMVPIGAAELAFAPLLADPVNTVVRDGGSQRCRQLRSIAAPRVAARTMP